MHNDNEKRMYLLGLSLNSPLETVAKMVSLLILSFFGGIQ